MHILTVLSTIYRGTCFRLRHLEVVLSLWIEKGFILLTKTFLLFIIVRFAHAYAAIVRVARTKIGKRDKSAALQESSQVNQLASERSFQKEKSAQ